MQKIFIAWTAISISAVSSALTKTEAMGAEKKYMNTVPITDTTPQAIKEHLVISLTRSRDLAPQLYPMAGWRESLMP